MLGAPATAQNSLRSLKRTPLRQPRRVRSR